jgi:hypothetical protein
MWEGETTMGLTDTQRLEIQAHKTYLSGVIKDSQSEYSKQLLSLSSAILALSVAFLKNLVSIQSAIWLPLLYVSWALFLATIFITLVAIKISIKAHQIYKDDLDKILDGKINTVGETWRDRLMPKVSWLSTTCFAIGILSLVVFSVVNIQKEKIMSDQTYANPTYINPNKETHTGIKHDLPIDHVEVQRIKVPPPAAPPPAVPAITTPPPAAPGKADK